MNNPVVWTIAGSDSSGGAGIQADLRTFQSLRVHGCSVITAVTAQNSTGIEDICYVPAHQITSQISALEKDLYPSVIKLGMLGNISNIDTISKFLKRFAGKIILDPLLRSTSGVELFSSDTKEYIVSLKQVFPLADLVTPNLNEAEIILNQRIQSYQDLQEAAHKLLALGAKSVLLKGGHFSDTQFSQDYWTNGTESFWLCTQRALAKNYRGTGCLLSSAITALLALGYEIKDALVISKMYITQSIRLAQKYGQAWIASAQSSHHESFGSIDGWPENIIDLPFLTAEPMIEAATEFPPCGDAPLGLYPIVDSVDWLKKLLPLGIKTAQLRIKNKTGVELENEIKQGIELSKKFEARLFINDYWQLAIRFNAYGVHLGQEDLSSADIQAIRKAEVRLGISTHCYYEVARAHAFKPSYIACGPIFPTTSKEMNFSPQGLLKLSRWQRTLDYPIVAIGGIDLEKFNAVLSTDVDGVAMISAITQDPDPILMTQTLLAKCREYESCRKNKLS